MPHAAHIREEELGELEFCLARSRLHARAARYRLQQGKLAAGVAALYDALAFGMRWYALLPAHKKDLGIGERIPADSELAEALGEAGVFDRKFDFAVFETYVEEALTCDLYNFDPELLLLQIETALARLGAMPFDESTLPPLNPDLV